MAGACDLEYDATRSEFDRVLTVVPVGASTNRSFQTDQDTALAMVVACIERSARK